MQGSRSEDGRYPGYSPRSTESAPPPRRRRGTVWQVLAAVALVVAAGTCLGYGGWAMSARRAVFADLAAGEGVSAAVAQESDHLHEQLLTAAVIALVVAIALWLLAHLLSRRPLATAGFTAVALFVTGAMLAVGGAYVTSLVDGVAEADRAAIGFLIMGGGFLLLGSGAVAAVVALFRARRSPTPAAGFTAWREQ